MKIMHSFILISLAFYLETPAQTPNFKKYQINQSGRYAYFPADPGVAEVSQSEDGSDVYTLEVEFDEAFYGLILVDFVDGSMDGSSKQDMEDLLIAYLDFLQGELNIAATTGYGTGHTLESNPEAAGVIDFWEDSEGAQYIIKGWVDTKTLAVMYIQGKEPAYNVKEMFLTGFRFN